ncbi:DUF4189 domain-containing protein [Dyella sp. KULCS107]|uniref:DUF4189 domain-containing protein n=1 Tax=Dyella sp. KULCS107 TaxID=3422216 RepID=UPI003D6DE61B
MKAIRLSILVFLLALTKATLAEGNCPPGYYPIGAPNGQAGPQGCAPIPGYSASPQGPAPITAPPPRWESRWLAVATDAPNGVLGTALDLPTRNAAESAAMQDCVNKGGTECEISLSLGNGCAALAAGKTGFNVRGGETEDEARTRAMKTCDAATTGCAVYFSACSPPVRVQ